MPNKHFTLYHGWLDRLTNRPGQLPTFDVYYESLTESQKSVYFGDYPDPGRELPLATALTTCSTTTSRTLPTGMA